ncbi:MAG: hypothetical protein AMJ81_03545 [Phycisphaerae bacterium SM23_33]|nr:MAG: hypothetical protein AMJ81_03545 [Phycisphaerae bacterium SM23_33]
MHQALKSMGWAVPEAEDEVRRAEAELAQSPAALPESLADAAAVFEARAGGPDEARVVSFPAEAASEDHLARAAREGGPIPSEIEERMRRDREAAERELEKDHDGQDVR